MFFPEHNQIEDSGRNQRSYRSYDILIIYPS